jgi:hypothetical protein
MGDSRRGFTSIITDSCNRLGPRGMASRRTAQLEPSAYDPNSKRRVDADLVLLGLRPRHENPETESLTLPTKFTRLRGADEVGKLAYEPDQLPAPHHKTSADLSRTPNLRSLSRRRCIAMKLIRLRVRSRRSGDGLQPRLRN